MEWYQGYCLLNILETINHKKNTSKSLLRFPIQLVNRPNQDFRGYSGTVTSGQIILGQKIKIASSDQILKIKEIITFDGNLKKESQGDAITVRFDKDVDISRGDIVVDHKDSVEVVDQIQAYIIWMDEKAGYISRHYYLKIGNKITL